MQKFGPSTRQINQVKSFLGKYGLSVQGTSSNHNVVTAKGTYAQIERAFHVPIEQYTYKHQTFYANPSTPQVPNGLASVISSVVGLTTYHAFHNSITHMVKPQKNKPKSSTSSPSGYSPQQIASAYQITPLYKKHDMGQGTTIAVATLATFRPQDAATFWKYYHINRGSASLSVVPVDGGFPSGDSGAGSGRIETSLDVERSGSIAPKANIMVYEAPNTNQGFLDLFNQVVSQDKAQVMTCSWGEDELLATPAYDHAISNIFMEGAAQGQSLFAASGDYGAYDGYPIIPTPSVDFPASSPYITAAGGTTLPMNGQIPIPNGSIPMTHEHGWGWSYLLPYYKNFGYPSEAAFLPAIFPIGSGGGTSLVFHRPFYQKGAAFPHTVGRNMPDIALNADPFTGYAIYDTSPNTSYGSGWINGFGGTSFASPQWAGIAADLNSALKRSLGFANPILYDVFNSPLNTSTPAYHIITKGNNWYYKSHYGYNRVTGLGSPNVANLLTDIQALTTP